jgi:hypothetical protein
MSEKNSQDLWSALSAAEQQRLVDLLARERVSEATRHEGRSPSLPSTTGTGYGERQAGGAPGTHTPRALAAAQTLAQLPTATQGASMVPRALGAAAERGGALAERNPVLRVNSIMGPQGLQGVPSEGPRGESSRHASRNLDEVSRRELDELSRSIDKCMNLIDSAKSQAPESIEHQELLLHIAQLEMQIRMQQTEAAAVSAHSARMQPAPQARDAPSRRASDLVALSAACDAHRDAPRSRCLLMDGDPDGVALSDIEHRSVSVADHPVTQQNRKGSQCGISQVDVQAIVEQTVQECMRNMQSQTAAPQVYASRADYRIPFAREVPATAAAAHQYKPLEELANPRYDLSMSAGAHTSWLNRELRLPKFKGYEDENPLDFLTKFERFAAALSHLNLDQACRQCMPLALTDEAEQWMIAESKRWPLDYSFKEFSQALVDRFLPHDYVDRMRRFLETRMQGENETLARFITVIETAYARMGVKSSEREVIRRISTQLNPTYNQLIGHRYFGSIHEISKHARAIDAQVHRQKSFKVVKADCPDADLNVLSYPPKTSNESSQTQLVGRGDNQRSSRTGGANGSWNEFKDHVDSKSEINKEYSKGEEIPKLKFCYSCGEPSHLANKCPMRGDSAKGKHGVKGEDTGNVTRVFATRESSGKRGTHLGKLRKRCKAMEPRIQVWSAAIPVNAMLDCKL